MPIKLCWGTTMRTSQLQMDRVKQHSKAKCLPTHTQTHTAARVGISTASLPTQRSFWSMLRPMWSLPQRHTETHVQPSETYALYGVAHKRTIAYFTAEGGKAARLEGQGGTALTWGQPDSDPVKPNINRKNRLIYNTTLIFENLLSQRSMCSLSNTIENDGNSQ